jgi:hypothetical protein
VWEVGSSSIQFNQVLHVDKVSPRPSDTTFAAAAAVVVVVFCVCVLCVCVCVCVCSYVNELTELLLQANTVPFPSIFPQ